MRRTMRMERTGRTGTTRPTGGRTTRWCREGDRVAAVAESRRRRAAPSCGQRCECEGDRATWTTRLRRVTTDRAQVGFGVGLGIVWGCSMGVRVMGFGVQIDRDSC